MQGPPNYLRTFRRKSPLTQKDVALLLQSIQSQSISNVERGKNRAKIELLLVYHLLFDTTVESLFELKHRLIQLELIKNVKNLFADLGKKSNKTRLDDFKLRFLEEIIQRLES